ncbi:MAG: SMP-30/gluconolactonase/LRE family protein [Planctomycetia bacterium]|nr:SMP-30/gluconolactonase/LRE family protein [Planctomycetia bacterium]
MRMTCLVAALLVAFSAATARSEVTAKPVVTNLNNPSGLAIQPETGEIYIADSGNQRVLRFKDGEKKADRSIAVAISGFGKDVYGKGPMYDIGPLGLLFLSKNSLVVGDGGQKDGSEQLHFFTLPDSGSELKVDAGKAVGPIAPGEQSAMGEGNFYALASSGKSVFVTSNGDDTKGWVLKCDVDNNEPGKLETFIATKVATEVDAPVGITMDKDGNLVVGQMGEVNVPKDSLYTVYDKEGKLLVKAKTDLNDIAALAFHPKTGKLYAVDFAWMDSKEGGLYRLDVTKEGEETKVAAVKLASLDKPTAMAFTADGTLYVTVFGTTEEGVKNAAGQPMKPGKLLKITGDL